MRTHLLFLLLLALGSARAQTRDIARKSHSGDAYEEFTPEAPDFGRAPEREERYAKLDSVIYLSDSVAVMVTSNWCKRGYGEDRAASRWRAGRDTVRRHPLFSARHSLDSIKTVLRTNYFFRNPVDSVRFIGYDNHNSCEDYQPFALAPIAAAGDDDGPPPPATRLLLLGLITLAAGFTGLGAWLLRRTPAVS